MRLLTLFALIGLALIVSSPRASAETRSLKLYHVHTGEKAIITYKRNGHYIPAGLKKLDYILRDWRKDREIEMDPRLFDLLWEVYQKSGSHDYIHVICGYRTGDTNAMLRGRSRASGVAKKSQHILGKAIDFYIPDVPLEKLREIGMKFQVGGVGYYPNSGSPFVHMDTGWVRAWPRMSREQLVRLFPNGRTLHLPPDGRPLSGYEEALADYKRRVSSDSILVAGGGSSGSSRSGGNFLAALFGRGTGDEDESGDEENVAVAQASPRPARLAQKAMAPLPGVDGPAPASPAAQPKPGEAPLPGIRPVAIASADPGPARLPAADVPGDASASDGRLAAPKYADLLAYAVPIPTEAPGRGTGVGPSAPAGGAAVAAVEKESAGSIAVAQIASVPVPDLRPELTAYAPAAASPAAELAAALAPPTKAKTGPLRAASDQASAHRPVTPVPAMRKAIAPDAPVVLASLGPVPGVRPEIATEVRPAPRPHHAAKAVEPAKAPVRFTAVSGAAIRGGRLPGAAAHPVLTREAIAKWAQAKAEGGELVGSIAGGATPRMGRLQPVAGSAHGDGIDPQRFAAVSVYFPND
ncbi:MAG: DUF882 domain-containing protein [Pararhizobium sp.]